MTFGMPQSCYELNGMVLVRAFFPPSDAPQAADDTVEELGGSLNSMERKPQ